MRSYLHLAKNKRILVVSSVLLVLLALFYKRPDAFTHSQFHGEEGNVFFSDAYHHGFRSLFTTCAGYFHLYPRLVFCLAISSGIPYEFMPYISCYAWLFVMLGLVAYIWARVELDPVRKLFVVLSTALIPLQAEILMNLTNVQWIMALFPILIFSSSNPLKNRKWFWIDAIVLVLTGFTGPNALILLPLIFFLAYKERASLVAEPRRLFLYALSLVPAIACLIALVSHGTVNRSEGEFVITNPAFIEYLHLQYGFLFLAKLAYDMPLLLKCLFILLLFAFGINTCRKILTGKIEHGFTVAAFFAGLLYLLTTLISYRNNPSILHPHYGAARNFYLPAVCGIWFMISVLKPANNPVPVLCLLMLLFVFENVRCVGRERFTDYNWTFYAKKIGTADTLSIPINPEGWRIYIIPASRNK